MIRKLCDKTNIALIKPTINFSDEATDVITGVGGKTYLVVKYPSTNIATITDKATREKEFVNAKEFHAKHSHDD